MMRVAIVDDDPIVCSSLSTILKATGTADIAWTAYDGETAVGQYEEDTPDVLLIDVQMPVMDGYEATSKIRAMHRTDSDIPIFALTANAFVSDIGKAQSVGMNDHVSKPIDMERLTDILEQWIG
ncbi:MAG: response regulator [Bifidobacterium pseudocatenulatum]